MDQSYPVHVRARLDEPLSRWLPDDLAPASAASVPAPAAPVR